MKQLALTAYDRIYMHLFDDADQTKLSDLDYKVKQRVQAVFTKKLDHPTIEDKGLVKFICEQFNVQKSTAYADINAVETIFGNIRKANKEFVRLMVTEKSKQVINIELNRISKDLEANGGTGGSYSTKDLTAAINVLARANNLDKEDPDMPNWDEIQPPIIEPTDDVTVMDLEPVPDETIKALKAKYLGKIEQLKNE
jgi:hypothetical protein